MVSRERWAGLAAAFWAAVVFMPVGLNYLGFAVMLLALCVDGRWRERVLRLRASALWWPLAAYVGWTLFVLVVGPHYPETAFNLWHGLRIAATIAAAMTLTDAETSQGLKGFVTGTAFEALAIVLGHTVGLPDFPLWHHVVIMKGNKSINDALLFTLAGAAAAIWGTSQLWNRQGRRVAGIVAIAVLPLTMAVTIFALPSRTSLVGLLVALAGACCHRLRRHPRGLAVAFAAIGIAAAAVVVTPSVQKGFALGMQEIHAAQDGAISEGSWVVRFYMYRDTTAMVLERPWIGWGIGAWTSEWKRRAPPLLVNYNMPHNDFLWMGSQAGIPGMLTLLVVVLAGLLSAWRQTTLAGCVAFSVVLILFVATCLNSAMRDAAIGLSLLWITFLILRRAVPGISPLDVARRIGWAPPAGNTIQVRLQSGPR